MVFNAVIVNEVVAVNNTVAVVVFDVAVEVQVRESARVVVVLVV